MFNKYFTIEEAEHRLPLVKKIVADILQSGQRIKRLSHLRKNPEVQEEISLLASRMEGWMLELEELGCFFKDWNFETGLVDFPAFINGEEVFLCWRSDEDAILFYHRVEDGYAGRLPLK